MMKISVYSAYVRCGRKLKEIAVHPGVHYAALIRSTKRIEQGGHMCYCKT
ncbi:MAG: hypothetical protein ABSB22_21405 [Thermodesulfobacteriota bacterium]